MSKDKGSKNVKKAPADKSLGKKKGESSYKQEGKSAQPTLDPFMPKTDLKTGKPSKS
jgi:hypothetical protein